VCDLKRDGHTTILYILTMLTSAAMATFKMAEVQAIHRSLIESDRLEEERQKLLNELQRAAVLNPRTSQRQGTLSGASHRASESAARMALPSLAQQDSPRDIEFITARGNRTLSEPKQVVAVPLEASRISSVDPVRGVCPACEVPVLASDVGRVVFGGKYYHAACVKGSCGLCGKPVLSDQDRVKGSSGVYQHAGSCPDAQMYTEASRAAAPDTSRARTYY
jgi:hypothetical protein